MKIIAWIFGIIFSLILLVYIVAFTSFGNSMLVPTIESKIKEQTKMDSKLRTFSLSMSEIDVVLEINKENIVKIKGDYSLFLQSFDLDYKLELNDLSTLKSLTQVELKNSFFTSGKVKGDMAFIEIDGVSDVASSATSYHVELKDLNPTSIIAKIDGAKLDKLLEMGAQKNYADALINLDINFKSIEPNALDGDVVLKTKNGTLNTKVMRDDFNITIPAKTAFAMGFDAKLKGNDVVYNYELISNLFKVTSSGSLTPEPLKLDVKYALDIKELALLKPMIGVDARGSLRVDGSAKGTKEKLVIDALSDIASSQTVAHVELKDFTPTSIIAKMEGAKLDKLLEMGAQKNYADALINLDINFKSIEPNALDGDVVLKTKNGTLNTKVMRDDFNITIPANTTFAMGLNAKLKGPNVVYSYELASNLFNVNSSGTIAPQPLKLDVKYTLDIKELALLKPISGADVRGAIKVDGTAKGTKEKLLVDAISDVASSETVIFAALEDFEPKSVKARIKHLDIAKLLYMAKQPHYTDGKFFLEADITDARESKLRGEITTSIKDGLLDSNYITKTYEFKSAMPRTTFKLDTRTSLDKDVAISKVDLYSSLAEFNIKSAEVDIKSGKILSDYKVTIPNLDSLYFATEQHMRGSLSANGDFTKDKDMTLNVYSKVAGGEIVARLHNDDLKADIKNIQTLDALHMLIYPEMFKSSLDAKLNYNLAHKKGKFDGYLKDGSFTKNEMLDLIKQYARIDMYVERFKGDVNADIDNQNITASLGLNSNTSSINTKNARLDTQANSIDSKIDIVANKNPISVTLKGNISSPKVSIDAKELMKKEAAKIIKKEANKAIEKELGKSLDKEVGKLLKGFF
ncbi:MAG: hypothetical protein RBS11_07165 [Sulfurimonas sp.]|nr:hypothetical protein [Sulfurimonas sp.]